jgi:hypothetical protein
MAQLSKEQKMKAKGSIIRMRVKEKVKNYKNKTVRSKIVQLTLSS